MRAFVAVEVADAARRSLAAAARELRESVRARGVSWTRPESYHLTLRFLGEIDPARVPDLAREMGLRVRGCAPFALQLAGVEAFPSARRPRVLAARVEPEAPLAALARRVEAGLAAAGLAPEPRPFRAHLTLGRVRDRAHPDPSVVQLDATPFLVSEVVLFESVLHPDGAIHTPLERLPLEGPDSRATRTPEGEVHAQERPLH